MTGPAAARFSPLGAWPMLRAMQREVADSELMIAYVGGDSAAFDLLYARYRGPLYRYIGRQVAAAATDDLFQEVWMRVIRARDRYRPSAPFGAYLFRIAHNVVVDHYRRSAAQPASADHDPDALPQPDPDAAERLDQTQQKLRLAAAIRSLPADQRDALLLHEEAGLTLEQIGAVTGVGRETVKSRLRYAFSKLREQLDNHRDDGDAS